MMPATVASGDGGHEEESDDNGEQHELGLVIALRRRPVLRGGNIPVDVMVVFRAPHLE